MKSGKANRDEREMGREKEPWQQRVQLQSLNLVLTVPSATPYPSQLRINKFHLSLKLVGLLSLPP